MKINCTELFTAIQASLTQRSNIIESEGIKKKNNLNHKKKKN